MKKIIILIWRILKFSYQYQNSKLLVCFDLLKCILQLLVVAEIKSDATQEEKKCLQTCIKKIKMLLTS